MNRERFWWWTKKAFKKGAGKEGRLAKKVRPEKNGLNQERREISG